jgi:hypothetical protein
LYNDVPDLIAAHLLIVLTVGYTIACIRRIGHTNVTMNSGDKQIILRHGGAFIAHKFEKVDAFLT